MEIEERGGLGLKPVKTRTSVVTNSVKLAAELKQRQCKGDHVHANTFCGRIKQCEIYPEEFCELICRAVSSEKELNALIEEPRSSCRLCLARNCPTARQRWEAAKIVKDVTGEINALMASMSSRYQAVRRSSMPW